MISKGTQTTNDPRRSALPQSAVEHLVALYNQGQFVEVVRPDIQLVDWAEMEEAKN